MAHNPYPDFAWTVDYDAEVPCVMMTWQGYATSKAFRAANEQIVGVIARRNTSKMLADVKHFVLIGAEDQDWLARDWIPWAMEAGMKTVAIVTPTFHFNRVAITSVAEKLDPERLTLQFFADRKQALAWLAAC
jgi:hypothetical protein